MDAHLARSSRCRASVGLVSPESLENGRRANSLLLRSLWVQKLEGLGCDPQRLYALHRESAARGLAGVQSASTLEEGLRRLTDLLDLFRAQLQQGTPDTREWLHAVHDRWGGGCCPCSAQLFGLSDGNGNQVCLWTGP